MMPIHVAFPSRSLEGAVSIAGLHWATQVFDGEAELALTGGIWDWVLGKEQIFC